MRAVLTGVCIAAALSACGSGQQVVSQETADALHQRVTAVRTALESDRVPAARTAVDELRDEIRRQVDAGELASADALVLLEQAAGIAEGIEKRIARSTPSPEPTPTRTRDAAPAKKGADSRDMDSTDSTDDRVGKPGKGNGKAKGMRK
ncbi:MAG: hypothetical protein ACT4P1_04605 [Sporichthyaceae bacterium]